MFRDIFLKRSLLSLLIILIMLLIRNEVLAHSWNAPKEAALQQNTISLNLKSINDGKAIYTENCAGYHGDKAEGQSSGATGLKKDSPNLIKRLKNHSDGDFFWKIQNGKDEMPSFKEDLSVNDIWNVVNFIKSLGNIQK